MGNISFTEKGFEQYSRWQLEDKKMTKKIIALIKDINRNGLSKGIGKPEPLKWKKEWSRRIDEEHRLVYTMDEHQNIIISSCRGHYDD